MDEVDDDNDDDYEPCEDKDNSEKDDSLIVNKRKRKYTARDTSVQKKKRNFIECKTKLGSFQCDVCLETFPTYLKILKHHKEEHTSKKHFPCPECGKVFTSKGGWISHSTLVHSKFSERSLNCEWCGQQFLEAQRYRAHVKNCKKTYTFKCDTCGKFFRSLDAVETHKLLEHSAKDVITKLKCNICEEVFGTENAREKHEQCHKDPNNQCNECHKWFLSPEACERHKKSHDPNTSRKEMMCQYCNRIFIQRKAFIRHVELHKDTKLSEKFECPVCGKQCKSQHTYKIHKMLHLPNEEKPHKCHICGKGFVTRKGLGIHVMTHSDKKYVFCEFCGEGYKEQRHLNVSTVCVQCNNMA